MEHKYGYSSCSAICLKGEHGDYGLYLGDVAARDDKNVKKLLIGTVISIGEETFPKKQLPGVNYHAIPLRDQPTQKILHLFDKITETIAQSRQHSNVLVHCFHGASRSASFVIAYIMKVANRDYEDAYKYVKSKRPCVSPNQGFRQQLQAYEKMIHQQSGQK